MEGKKFSMILMSFLVIGLLVRPTTASFGKCMKDCFSICSSNGEYPVDICALICVKKCIFPTFDVNSDNKDSQYFCNLGCAYSSFSNLISTKRNFGEKQVESSVYAQFNFDSNGSSGFYAASLCRSPLGYG
ncbi:unnamed protein product [Dovyalis caffra]|uniref:Thionin-like protein 2 n=1 Tax=Dovyalis caffra TaxID=77055 RepID=A0AAV1RSD0_9ROSI|nr:unnamed protein product [Dovyalis caffra]